MSTCATYGPHPRSSSPLTYETKLDSTMDVNETNGVDRKILTEREEKRGERRKTVRVGNKNSAEDKPNHIPLKARPLLLLKYLEIVVDEV